jgi:hypothetical protein
MWIRSANGFEGGASGGGVWRIDNPFGKTAVSYLKFTAKLGLTGSDINVSDDRNSDNNIVDIDASSVPEPATVLLLGFGLIGLAGFGQKR